ncbi:XTP/dITP diphosphatase [Gottfriedia acidiceleris]|uniref:XTP/dITP diphosphatase n=1 Tax=Gottfriedia acidiceleris TaxID=371036 RepID=UPI002FFDDFE2
METIIIATNNQGKVKDFEALFNPMGFQIKSLKDFPEIQEVEETGTTFEENAILKAEFLARELNTPVIADDSGLIVDALEGRPGVYSARYAGLHKSDEDNLQKVLSELEGVFPGKRTARFYCALALAVPGKKTITVYGTVEGYIANEKRGTNGFGYDPIFFLPELDKTMAELTTDEKGGLSHRANAIKSLMNVINKEDKDFLFRGLN